MGECFGLLGVNGARKTTTFRMLTGDLQPSEGESFIHGYAIRVDKRTYLKHIGYCPQFDTFNFALTGRELLTLFAYLRGIPRKYVKSEVDKWVNKFRIKEHENKVCAKYSGGNKRKLSAALALMGDPPMIMMDEPSVGVDPVARRRLWDAIEFSKSKRQAIVITTHSMEEGEALCDRLGILAHGQFQCNGNITQLKSSFKQGFTVNVKLVSAKYSKAAVNKIKYDISQQFICKLKKEHRGLLEYHIDPARSLGVSDIFSFMENLKSRHALVEDYTVNDTTLEEVFLSFADPPQTPPVVV